MAAPCPLLRTRARRVLTRVLTARESRVATYVREPSIKRFPSCSSSSTVVSHSPGGRRAFPHSCTDDPHSSSSNLYTSTTRKNSKEAILKSLKRLENLNNCQTEQISAKNEVAREARRVLEPRRVLKFASSHLFVRTSNIKQDSRITSRVR